MNWLRKKINNWLNYEDDDYVTVSDTVYEDHELRASGLSIKVYSATGGLVIKVQSEEYSVIGKSDSTLHIIPKDQDLATSLAKIITLEILRGK